MKNVTNLLYKNNQKKEATFAFYQEMLSYSLDIL